jgi:hypothetical protein
MALPKGTAVRPRAPDVEGAWEGPPGTVMGMRPDGFVVVQLPGGARRPFRAEDLEPA